MTSSEDQRTHLPFDQDAVGRDDARPEHSDGEVGHTRPVPPVSPRGPWRLDWVDEVLKRSARHPGDAEQPGAADADGPLRAPGSENPSRAFGGGPAFDATPSAGAPLAPAPPPAPPLSSAGPQALAEALPSVPPPPPRLRTEPAPAAGRSQPAFTPPVRVPLLERGEVRERARSAALLFLVAGGVGAILALMLIVLLFAAGVALDRAVG